MLYTGILYLDKIFGREKKKLLYRCIPYDKKLSHPLIPYEKKYTFHKKDEPIYILFRYREETRENGILIETIGKISIKENYYLYTSLQKNPCLDNFGNFH